MNDLAIRIEKLSKHYRLGSIGSGTLREDLGRWYARVRGRPDPLVRVDSLAVTETGQADKDLWALRDIDLDVAEGEVLGIIGHNGAGKSTLLKILSRITAPTSGRVLIRGRVASLLEVGTGMHPELTGRENIYLNGAILGMTRREVTGRLDEIIEFSGVERFVDTPVKRYSSGMRVRLAFAVAAHLEPEILIVDEVLAVGDDEFQRRCLGKMKDVSRQGRTVLFVAHNMSAIQRLCERVVWMRAGEIVESGEPSRIISNYLESSMQAAQRGTSAIQGEIFSRVEEPGAPAFVHRVSLLDGGVPSSHVSTWDETCFRIEFTVATSLPSIAVELVISSLEGMPLLLSSTSPDRQIAFAAEPGRYVTDCVFKRLPLAAGDYLLSVRLAIPRRQYIWREDAAGTLTVREQDVFGSGLPPSTKRYFVAAEHDWTRPHPVERDNLDARRTS